MTYEQKYFLKILEDYVHRRPSVMPSEKVDWLKIAEYAREHDNFIIDARLGWYAVPESYKVYLKVDIDVAAQRAFNDKNRKRYNCK